MKGMGWLRDPKKAWYNWLYHRTSISLPRLLGYKPSFGGTIAALFVGSLFNLFSLPYDTVEAATKSRKIKKAAKERGSNFGKVREFTDDEFHEPRLRKASTEKKETLKEEVTSKKIEETKPNKVSKPVTRSTSTTTKPKSETPVKNSYETHTYTPVSDTKISRITTSEIVANTYKQDFPKKAQQNIKESTIVIDENAPKSKPKSENDQYVNKRIFIESPNESIIPHLETGTYLEVSKDEESGRIILLCEGKKAGLIPDADSVAIKTCLRLGRKMYAVVTDVGEKIEIEMWFGK